jgi:rod shape determining protein RodA
MAISRLLKRKWKSLDWTQVFLVSILISIGLTALYSIEFQQAGIDKSFFARQVIWSLSGIIAFFIAFFIPQKVLFNFAYVFYGFALLLLITTAFIGSGSVSRWIMIGSVGLQSSEFMKIALIIAIARYFADHKIQLRHWKEFIPPILLTLVPVILVLIQPDLGTSLVFVGLLFIVIFWGGIYPLNYFLLISPLISMIAVFNVTAFFIWMAIFVLVLAVSKPPIIWTIGNFILNIGVGGLTSLMWDFLKPYQQNRILSLFKPELDPLGSGYQLSQSLTAFGSGGVYGKGFGQGTQTHLKFLPEQHSDFIMTVIGEEFGFASVIFVILLLTYLIARMIYFAGENKYRFNSMMLLGGASILFLHSLVNLGMIVGLLPVTGIPLPFISYGGSFLLTAMIIVGLAANMISNDRM